MPSVSLTIRRACRAMAGPAVLVALMVWILHRALFSGGTLAPAWPGTDLFSEYMPWRYYAFGHWAHGEFPWWDPHIFAGNPFFAQIQSCLFYPIAWVNFFFSTATATTLEATLNLAIGAVCMYAWARGRGISRCGATLAGIAFPLSGPIYPHVLDGYLTVLSTAAWMPLVFLALDRLLAEQFISGIFMGALAVCLEILAGHAQLVYYTFLAGGLYVLLQSIGQRKIVRLYFAFAALWLLGGMLAGLQLLPTYLANQLSVRAGGVSYAYASMLSLPPENFLTVVIPYPLGGMTGVPYLGRWLLWETSLYVGIVVLALACMGIAGLPRGKRWRMMVLLAAILVLALGAYTPVHWILYQYLPGFGLFRDPAKFNSLWALLLAVLAGHGWDRVRRGEARAPAIWLTAIGAGLCILLAGIAYHFDSADGPVGRLLGFIYHSRAFCGPEKDFQNPLVAPLTSQRMAWQWALAALLLAATTLLIYLRRFSIKPAYCLLALALAESVLAAAACNTLTPLQQPFPQQWTKAVANANKHDQRLLFANGVTYTDMADALGYDSVWGYSPGQPRRFTQLIAASQGEHPVWADQYAFEIDRPSRIFQLLRCRYLLQWSGKYPVLEVRDPLPHVQLIGTYAVMSDPVAIADALAQDFDFRHSAILETAPQPAPVPGAAAGRVTLLRQSINDLEISADLPAPALLLITDAYAPGWRVRPLEPDPPQPRYEVLRADDVMRAIPLSAGHHHLDLYYRAPGWPLGVCMSVAAALIWMFGVIFMRSRRSVAPAAV